MAFRSFRFAVDAVKRPVEYRILGPLEVVDEGEPIALGT